MKEYYTLKELPISERPYEKCETYGPGILSDAELLSVIIRCGSKNERAVDVASKVLNYSSIYKGLIGLNFLTVKELRSIKGIGRVKAIQLTCIAELTKRMAKATRERGIRLTTSETVANYYMQDMRHLNQEKILLIMLDSKSQIIKDIIISAGTVNSSILPLREICVTALKYEAVGIIIMHNHPSGDPTPSKEDIVITKKLQEAINLIGIKLMDHIIIGDNTYISLNEERLL